MTAALGFAGIPPEVFTAVFNYAEDGGTIAFNPMDEFLEEKDPSGVAETIEEITDSVSPEESLRVHYVHRRFMAVTPSILKGLSEGRGRISPAVVRGDKSWRPGDSGVPGIAGARWEAGGIFRGVFLRPRMDETLPPVGGEARGAFHVSSR